MTIDAMVDELVTRGVIACDTRSIARSTLVRELKRRTRRISLLLVLIAEREQFVKNPERLLV